MKLRSDYKDAFVEKHGVKLGLMSGFVKVCGEPVAFITRMEHAQSCALTCMLCSHVHVCFFHFLPAYFKDNN